MTRKKVGWLVALIVVFISTTPQLLAISIDSSSGDKAASLGNEIAPANGCEAMAAAAPESTFVMFDAATSMWVGCNIDRARTRYLPASTFKVPHALIALETDVVEDVEATIAWDGRERAVSHWNKDTSLASGMENSTVWFYQRTARNVGHKRMQNWVEKLRYGNGQIGEESEIGSFWLDGALRISAIEQVDFLDQLRRGALPASLKNQDAVAAMMRLKDLTGDLSTSDSLYRKSGAVLPINPETGDIDRVSSIEVRLESLERVGWFIGWIVDADNEDLVRIFALNLNLRESADYPRRQSLTRMLLRENPSPITTG